jgi:hypothetical protein
LEKVASSLNHGGNCCAWIRQQEILLHLTALTNCYVHKFATAITSTYRTTYLPWHDHILTPMFTTFCRWLLQLSLPNKLHDLVSSNYYVSLLKDDSCFSFFSSAVWILLNVQTDMQSNWICAKDYNATKFIWKLILWKNRVIFTSANILHFLYAD